MKCEKQISYNRPAADLVLPESPELERAVLGALILEPEYLPDTAEMIEISAFQTPIHGKIYGMMLSMLAEGVKIDLYTLTQRCKTVEGLGQPGGLPGKAHAGRRLGGKCPRPCPAAQRHGDPPPVVSIRP